MPHKFTKPNFKLPLKNHSVGIAGIFEHKHPEKLLKKHAGTGNPKGGTMGQAGYKELVDFKEHIGIWKNEIGDSLSTTKEKIHYRKNGKAHIVPAHPDTKLW